MRAGWLALFAGVVAGCIGNIDPEWEINHDRVIAVRATPPHIPAGSASVLDAFLSHRGSDGSASAYTDVETPAAAIVSPAMPMSLQGAVMQSGSAWEVVAPSEDVLDAARAELMIGSGSAIPLEIALVFGSGDLGDIGSNGLVGSGLFAATKIVWLGDSADNPVVSGTLVNGVSVEGSAAITIPGNVNVPIATDADGSAGDTVNWFSACGTLYDDDEIKTFLNVAPTDSQRGEFAVVHRDGSGGVAWESWQMTAIGSGSSAQ
jgi:hypothetical protein